jgi:hypothetical protein
MIWQKPHVSRIYEALTIVADGRMELLEENNARCYTVSRDRYFKIAFNPNKDKIMSNDDGAFFSNALSAPILAYLFMIGRLTCETNVVEMFKDIDWQDLYKQYKNDYNKAIEHVIQKLSEDGTDIELLQNEVKRLDDAIGELKLGYLGTKQMPPKNE